MDKLNHYCNLLKKVLIDFNTPRAKSADYVPDKLIFDEVRDHYQVMAMSWDGSQQTYFVVLHLDIINDKIWLQESATNHDIIEDLLDLGVPNADIVLGFLPEETRALTGFAVI